MAAVDYFLKIDTLPGESHDSKLKDHIELESWSWGETNSGTHAAGGGGGAGKVSMQDFHFVMKVNKASPKLLEKCATGEHIPNAELICRKAGKQQQDFLRIKFFDLMISSFQTGGSSHGDVLPTDQISFNYSKMEYQYKMQKPDGNLDGPVWGKYSIKENKAY